MCYTTDEYAKPRTEVKYYSKISFATDGYRTDCNNIPVSLLAAKSTLKLQQQQHLRLNKVWNCNNNNKF